MVMRQKKPKPRKKVVIEYPPVPTKKWIPPDKRPKKPRKPAYVKPKGITQKLKVSSLKKVWHQFRVYDNMAVLSGHFSQTHKRFREKSKGFQGPCNCYVALAFTKIYNMEQWNEYMIDKVLETGDQLYLTSLQHLKDKCKVELLIPEVHNAFYLDKTRIQMQLENVITGFLLPGLKENGDLIAVLEQFFKNYPSGLLESQRKYFAIWKEGNSFYMFDPSDRTEMGTRWDGLRDRGFACVIRVPNVPFLAKWIYENLDTKVNSPFELYPCTLARMSQVNVTPPTNVTDVIKRPSITSVAPVTIRPFRKKKEPEKPPPPVPEKKPSDAPMEFPEDKNAEAQEFSPEIKEPSASRRPSWMKDVQVIKPEIKEEKKPLEELKTESVTYFRELSPKCGILRATTHQGEKRFGDEAGKQSIATAVIALAMLRLHKTKTWIPRILDEIINVGHELHKEIVKKLAPTEQLCLERIPKKIKLRQKEFAPDIEEYALIGRLQSTDDEVLDLLPALEQFLRENDATVINGPLILAVWVENGLFYMFDPNERDSSGKVIVKRMRVGSLEKVLEYKPGTACVTWYSNLKALVDVYFANIDKLQRKDQFVLSRVVINDFIWVPDPWHNFQGVVEGKWILSGTFSQKDKKFSPQTRDKQGTACASMALAFSTLKHEREWTRETLDEILVSGDKLHNDAVEELKRKNKFKDNKLMVGEVPQKFAFDATREVNLEVQDCLVNGIVSAKSNDNICNLRKGLEEFFIDNDTGVLTTKSLSMAVWKKDEIYYYYDSHSRDEKGVVTDFGTACVMRILNIRELAKSVETNLPPHPEDTFNISRVAVKIWEITEDGLARPPLNNYKEVDSRCSILRSNYQDGSEFFKLNKGKQAVAMCIVAFAMSKLYPASIWSVDVLDEVMKLGDELYAKSMAALLDKPDEEEKPKEEPKPPDTVSQAPTVKSKAPAAPAPEKKKEPPKEEPKPEPEPEKEPMEEIVFAADAITRKNVLREFYIGVNKFLVEISEETIEGGFKEKLKECLEKHFLNLAPEDKDAPLPPLPGEQPKPGAPKPPPPPKVEPPKPPAPPKVEPPKADAAKTPETPKTEKPEEEKEPKPLLLESNTLTLVLWKEGQIYYMFDPKSRDARGELYGKDLWSVIPPEPDSEEEDESEDEDEDEEEEEEGDEKKKEVGGGDAPNDETAQAPDDEEEEEDEEAKKAAAKAALEAEAEKIRKEEEDKKRRIKEAEEATRTEGRACIMWFTDFNRLVELILENTPPTKRHRMMFNLTPFEVKNGLDIKQIFDPETSVRTDFYEGNWYNFKEIEKGRWILRGKMDQNNELFPASNRGKQTIPNCYAALGFAFLFTISQFKPETIDTILKYGDRLYTFTKKLHEKALKEQKGLKLSALEIETIANNETYTLLDFPRKFCAGEARVNIGLAPDFIQGVVGAKDIEKLLDVKPALEKYFSEYKFGIMCAKGICVAIWRGQKVYYMFDPKSRGPNGVTSPMGKACITRYLDLQKMADVFARNIPTEGRNEFSIHKVWMKTQPCDRKRQPEPEEEKETPKTSCFKKVIPGKCVLRATINQNDPKFKKETENALSAPIAFVALAMTLVHKVQTWSTPLLDEIIELGNELYEATVDDVGCEFNPWEQTMTLNAVKNDFKIGVYKASCELRHSDQRGIIDIKASHTQNLRQGIEKFFEENTHGVLQAAGLTLAIWEDPKDCLIYMFDPYPRGVYGMPDRDGVGCVVTFVNAKIASDHIIAVIRDPLLLQSEFIITPVEVIVGDKRTKKKEPKKPEVVTSSLPRCTNLVASDKTKRRRKQAEEKRKRKEEKQQMFFGRLKYEEMPNGYYILRGLRSQASSYYPESTRNYQDLTNAIAAYVMHYLVPVCCWYYEYIDIVLDVGNQLYMDSYVVYSPRDRRLGLRDVLRSFWINNVLVNIVIFKPVIEEAFLHTNVVVAFTNLFQQRNVCLFGACNKWVLVVFKTGYYYLFDPRDKDMEGRKVGPGKGSATVIRYSTIGELATALLYTMIDDAKDEIGNFSVVLLMVERVETRSGAASKKEERVDKDEDALKRCCCNLCIF